MIDRRVQLVSAKATLRVKTSFTTASYINDLLTEYFC